MPIRDGRAGYSAQIACCTRRYCWSRCGPASENIYNRTQAAYPDVPLPQHRPGTLGWVSTNDSSGVSARPGPQRRIALVAHDGRKQDMLEWAEFNRDLLAGHRLYATATTGRMLSEQAGLAVTCFHSGPFGGDQQIGAKIADGEIDLLVFLWDPLEPQPHDHDIKALLRVAVLWNIPVACNRATADFLISSPLMNSSAVGHGPARQGC